MAAALPGAANCVVMNIITMARFGHQSAPGSCPWLAALQHAQSMLRRGAFYTTYLRLYCTDYALLTTVLYYVVRRISIVQ